MKSDLTPKELDEATSLEVTTNDDNYQDDAILNEMFKESPPIQEQTGDIYNYYSQNASKTKSPTVETIHHEKTPQEPISTENAN